MCFSISCYTQLFLLNHGFVNDILCSAFQFIVKDSVEERMLEMQERKRKLMTGAFAKPKAEEARKQRMNDVVNLFA